MMIVVLVVMVFFAASSASASQPRDSSHELESHATSFDMMFLATDSGLETNITTSSCEFGTICTLPLGYVRLARASNNVCAAATGTLTRSDARIHAS